MEMEMYADIAKIAVLVANYAAFIAQPELARSLGK